jgi:hypothetical protein
MELFLAIILSIAWIFGFPAPQGAEWMGRLVCWVGGAGFMVMYGKFREQKKTEALLRDVDDSPNSETIERAISGPEAEKQPPFWGKRG